MESLFYGCSSLKFLPDISKWDTSRVTNMQYMFCFCSSLKLLPDISNWNTEKVENIIGMFKNCSSLIKIPDISRWQTGNLIYIDSLFSRDISLISLPDISKWKIKNQNNYIIEDSYSSFLESNKSFSYLKDSKDSISIDNCNSKISEKSFININDSFSMIDERINEYDHCLYDYYENFYK